LLHGRDLIAQFSGIDKMLGLELDENVVGNGMAVVGLCPSGSAGEKRKKPTTSSTA
jgi:hypothetical protein